MPRRVVRRRWNLDQQGIRRVGSKESGFSYALPSGKPLHDAKTLARIQKLRIPPAWQEVRIARSDAAPLQAVGVDSKGRTQYLYHAKFRSRREEEKFQRVVTFGEGLPKLRRRVNGDLKKRAVTRDSVLAAIVRLIDQGFFRVGNDKSARHEETYGLTTVQSKHVKVSGSTVRFSFVGKWQKKHDRTIADADVAAIVRKLRRLEGGERGELFKFVQGNRVIDVKDRHVNEYLQSIVGPDYTAKDFRTWAGTLICSMSLAHQGQEATKKARKKRMKKAIEFTASMLGNTPAVCRSSYICPRLLSDYEEGRPFETLRKEPSGKAVPKLGLSLEERALLKFFRQTIADRRSRADRRRHARESDRRAA